MSAKSFNSSFFPPGLDLFNKLLNENKNKKDFQFKHATCKTKNIFLN